MALFRCGAELADVFVGKSVIEQTNDTVSITNFSPSFETRQNRCAVVFPNATYSTLACTANNVNFMILYEDGTTQNGYGTSTSLQNKVIKAIVFASQFNATWTLS